MKLQAKTVLKDLYQSAFKGTISHPKTRIRTVPLFFALPVDDIDKMSESEQKSLWIQINQDKIFLLAKELDSSVTPNTFSGNEINKLISEARKNGRNKKKS